MHNVLTEHLLEVLKPLGLNLSVDLRDGMIIMEPQALLTIKGLADLACDAAYGPAPRPEDDPQKARQREAGRKSWVTRRRNAALAQRR